MCQQFIMNIEFVILIIEIIMNLGTSCFQLHNMYLAACIIKFASLSVRNRLPTQAHYGDETSTGD